MNKSVFQCAKELCRELRKRSTKEEKLFWQKVRNRKVLGKKFFRQHPIFFVYRDKKTFFIADFYCSENRLVVEIDGKSHEYQKEYDELRTHIVNELGIEVVRFKNEEIKRNTEEVIEKLQVILSNELTLSAAGGLLEREGLFPFSS